MAPGGATKAEPQALRHMPEVRKGMIQLLRDDPEQKVKILAIQENAIHYYEPVDDPICRAEGLSPAGTEQDRATIAARWLPGVNDHFSTRSKSFEPVQQGFLAGRLGVDVDDSVLAQALPEDWEAIVTRRAQALLELRQFQQVLALLGQRTPRLPGSPLYLLEAQAYQQQGHAGAGRSSRGDWIPNLPTSWHLIYSCWLHASMLSNFTNMRVLISIGPTPNESRTHFMTIFV